MDEDSIHDVVAAICLVIVFNLWRQSLATVLFICLFVVLARSLATLRLLHDEF